MIEDETPKDKTKFSANIIRLVMLSLRTSFWVSAVMFSRVLSKCEHKLANKASKEIPEAVISNREENEKIPQTVTR